VEVGGEGQFGVRGTGDADVLPAAALPLALGGFADDLQGDRSCTLKPAFDAVRDTAVPIVVSVASARIRRRASSGVDMGQVSV
jgi:hypothetical protein